MIDCNLPYTGALQTQDRATVFKKQVSPVQVTGEPVAAAALAAWTYLADYAHSLEASRDDSHAG